MGALGGSTRSAALRAALAGAPGPRPPRAPRDLPGPPRPLRADRAGGGRRLPADGCSRPRARLRPRAAPPRRGGLRAAGGRALCDPECRLVPVAHALLRPGPDLEDRFRRAPRLLPDRAGCAHGDPLRGSAPPDGRARARGGNDDALRQGDLAGDHRHARRRAPDRSRADGRRRARGRDPGRTTGARVPHQRRIRPLSTADYAALALLALLLVVVIDGAAAWAEGRARRWTEGAA